MKKSLVLHWSRGCSSAAELVVCGTTCTSGTPWKKKRKKGELSHK